KGRGLIRDITAQDKERPPHASTPVPIKIVLIAGEGACPSFLPLPRPRGRGRGNPHCHAPSLRPSEVTCQIACRPQPRAYRGGAVSNPIPTPLPCLFSAEINLVHLRCLHNLDFLTMPVCSGKPLRRL